MALRKAQRGCLGWGLAVAMPAQLAGIVVYTAWCWKYGWSSDVGYIHIEDTDQNYAAGQGKDSVVDTVLLSKLVVLQIIYYCKNHLTLSRIQTLLFTNSQRLRL
jgi:hypothetical protein